MNDPTSATETTADEHGTRLVRIIIDKQPKESPRHTTGHALYVLGNVKGGFELREERADGHDRRIPDDATPEEVHEGEIFYSLPCNLNPGAKE